MFEHRSYLGWITDLASRPHPQMPWPVIDLEDWLLDDYANTFELTQHIGMNEIVVWGLFIADAWPIDLANVVDAERARRIRRLLSMAHERGIRVLSGLGVYSWGFARIIAEHPELARGNPRVMCASNPDAWHWQQRVVNYVFQWGIDGVSMQSADQGRCLCNECAALGDVEYHARLNARTADYIKENWPEALVGVNSWGMTFADADDLKHLVNLGQHVDYIIDAHDTASRSGDEHRRKLINSVGCRWGTIGGWAVEPPQHWQRERWFLPCVASAAPYIQHLYADGARACELYFRISANPGDEISFHTCGRLLSDPEGNWRQLLQQSIHELYAPKSERSATALEDLFLRAESAYFDNARGLDRIGTISLEPLVSSEAGEPIYLMNHMDRVALNRYEAELRAVQASARGLIGNVGATARVESIVRCIDGALKDVAYARERVG